MATQRCPKCNSNRIRQGYRPTPFLLKLIFIQNLLCDDCNWEFKGFAIPGTVTKKTKKKRNSNNDVDSFNDLGRFDDSDESEEPTNSLAQESNKETIIEKGKKSADENNSLSESLDFSATEPIRFASDFIAAVNDSTKKKSKVKKKVRVKMR